MGSFVWFTLYVSSLWSFPSTAISSFRSKKICLKFLFKMMNFEIDFRNEILINVEYFLFGQLFISHPKMKGKYCILFRSYLSYALLNTCQCVIWTVVGFAIICMNIKLYITHNELVSITQSQLINCFWDRIRIQFVMKLNRFWCNAVMCLFGYWE